MAGYLLGAPRAHSASHATGAPAQAAGEWGEPALLALHYAWTAGLAFACLAPAQAIAYLLLAQACARCPARVRNRRTCTQAAPVCQAACQDTGLDDAGEGHAQRQLCVLLRPSGAGLAGWS